MQVLLYIYLTANIQAMLDYLKKGYLIFLYSVNFIFTRTVRTVNTVQIPVPRVSALLHMTSLVSNKFIVYTSSVINVLL